MNMMLRTRSLILRNIHYYTGKEFHLNENEIEALRYNCEPLLKENSLKAIRVLLDKLDYITNCINKKKTSIEMLLILNDAIRF